MRRTLALLLGLGLAAPALAGTLAGVTLPETAKAGDEPLVLNGMALRSKAVFKVYVAGLYLPAEEREWKRVLASDAPRRVVMRWVRSVDKEAICDAWNEGLAANTPKASAEVREHFATLCGWMQDARAGDALEFTYLPGVGTTVAVQGKPAGTIPGKPFADALFACWIGPEPGPGEAFRAALMGGS